MTLQEYANRNCMESSFIKFLSEKLINLVVDVAGTFIATSTTGVASSAICTSRLLFFFGEILSLWCCCGTARRAFHFARYRKVATLIR